MDTGAIYLRYESSSEAYLAAPCSITSIGAPELPSRSGRYPVL